MPGQPGALFSARKRAEFLFRSSHVSSVRFFLGVVIAEVYIFSLRLYLRTKPPVAQIYAFRCDARIAAPLSISIVLRIRCLA